MSENMPVINNLFPVQPVNPNSEIQQFLECLWNAVCEAAGGANSEAEAAFSSVVSAIDSCGEIPRVDTLNVLKLMRKNSVVINIPKKEIGIDTIDII